MLSLRITYKFIIRRAENISNQMFIMTGIAFSVYKYLLGNIYKLAHENIKKNAMFKMGIFA